MKVVPGVSAPDDAPPADLCQLARELRALAAGLEKLEGEVLELKRQQPYGLRHRLYWCLGVRLYRLLQHEPRPLSVPDWYRRPVTLSTPPAVSIVTPSFNQACFLESTIRSVLDQHYPHLEYIVQDGGSSDGSTDILERYRSRLTHAESIPDRGQAHAINLGFHHATGDILAYLNSDDLLLPGSINYVAAYFHAHPDVDVVYGHRVIVDDEAREIGRWVLPRHSDRMLVWGDYVPQETLFWRRRIWERVGGSMDESFQFALDWDLLLRFREAKATIVRLPRFLGAFRYHSQQKTQAQSGVGQREMARLRRRMHRREVSNRKVQQGLRGYVLRQALYSWLYRLGVLQY
jgi:glycosyltransferase involved in cell wall biosynthesis